jgi:hypothetical protein
MRKLFANGQARADFPLIQKMKDGNVGCVSIPRSREDNQAFNCDRAFEGRGVRTRHFEG